MKPSSVWSLRFLEPLLGNRYFMFMFWILVSVLISAVIFLVLKDKIQNIELSLLDIKIRNRANVEDNVPLVRGLRRTLRPIQNRLGQWVLGIEPTEEDVYEAKGPSSDIVILAIDGNTDKFIRANPGEFGLTGRVLPRGTMAKIVNYLTDQGAKAIIFDVEFKEDREGDQELAAAIRRHGRVYAAARMDNGLKAFVADQIQALPRYDTNNWQRREETLWFTAVLKPYNAILALQLETLVAQR